MAKRNLVVLSFLNKNKFLTYLLINKSYLFLTTFPVRQREACIPFTQQVTILGNWSVLLLTHTVFYSLWHSRLRKRWQMCFFFWSYNGHTYIHTHTTGGWNFTGEQIKATRRTLKLLPVALGDIHLCQPGCKQHRGRKEGNGIISLSWWWQYLILVGYFSKL